MTAACRVCATGETGADLLTKREARRLERARRLPDGLTADLFAPAAHLSCVELELLLAAQPQPAVPSAADRQAAEVDWLVWTFLSWLLIPAVVAIAVGVAVGMTMLWAESAGTVGGVTVEQMGEWIEEGRRAAETAP